MILLKNPPFQTREAQPFPTEPYRPAAIDRAKKAPRPQAGRLGEFFLNSTSRAYFVNQNIAFFTFIMELYFLENLFL
jgi:hypothetical protein